MQVRLDRDAIAGLVCKAAAVNPALAPALGAVRSLTITEGFSPALKLTAKVGPITVGIWLELGAVDGEAEIRIAAISGNLFGVARKLAGDLIIKKISAVPHMIAERNRWGDISVAVDDVWFSSLGIVGGNVIADLRLG